MTKERFFENEALTMEALENVNGGTVEEFNDIWNALEKQAGVAGDISNGLRKILDLLPGGDVGSAAWRMAAAPLAEKMLKDCYGIKSNISIGWMGTGFRESHNSYSKNGKGLSHQQVLDIINAA